MLAETTFLTEVLAGGQHQSWWLETPLLLVLLRRGLSCVGNRVGTVSHWGRAVGKCFWCQHIHLLIPHSGVSTGFNEGKKLHRAVREVWPAGIITLHLFCRQSENLRAVTSTLNVLFSLFFRKKINKWKESERSGWKCITFHRHFSSEERKQSGWMLSWKNSRVNMSVNSDLAWMIPSQRKEITHKTFLLEALRFHLINCSEVSFKLEVCQGRSSCFWNTHCCQVLLLLLQRPAPIHINAKILSSIKILQKYSRFFRKI